jgi:tetratricopeptide (TPR) repeat protein
MKPIPIFRTAALAGILALSTAGCHRMSAEQQKRFDALRAAVGSQPLDDAAAGKLAAQKDDLDNLTSELQKLADKKESARIDWQIGDCHRMRHLFDEPGAWEESERRLSLALARNPAFAPAHQSLGQLYITGGFDYAPRAERQFVQALENAAGAAMPEAHKGLFLAYYYQGRWSESLTEADIYLKLVGNDADVQKMRLMAETNLRKKTEGKS